jgi:hypothetical protein
MPVFRFICATCGKPSGLGASNARSARLGLPPRNAPYDVVFVCEKCGAEHVHHWSAEKVEAFWAQLMSRDEPDAVPSSSTDSDSPNDDGSNMT